MASGTATHPRRIYRVELNDQERAQFQQVVNSGRSAGWKIRRAHAALKFDQGPHGPAWSDDRIAEAFGVSIRCLEIWRKKATLEGPLALLERKPHDNSKNRKLDGAGEARLVQLACSQAPEGHDRWSLRMLADELVALEVVESISHEAVRRTLKKTR